MHTREHLYIGGEWVAPHGEGSIEVVNPANEQLIGSVSVGSAAVSRWPPHEPLSPLGPEPQ